MTIRSYLLLCLASTLCLSVPSAGQKCTDDIVLVNGAGCATSCCYQSPPGSGNYIFKHREVENIDIRGNPGSVVSVSFPNLVSVEKRVRISYNQPGAVTNISFPALRTAGSIEVVGNSGLLALDLPRLMAIENEDYDAYLRVQNNANLASMHVPLLRNITAIEAGSAYLDISDNPALPNIDLPLLQVVMAFDDYGEAYVYVGNNFAVRQISMALQSLIAGEQSISYFIVYDMAQLDDLALPSLVELLPAGGASDFSELTIGKCPRLTEFVLPRLERVSLLQLIELKGTQRAMFPSLESLQYLWVNRTGFFGDSVS